MIAKASSYVVIDAATHRTKAHPRTCAMAPRTQLWPGPFCHLDGLCPATLVRGRRCPVLPRIQYTVPSLPLQSPLLPRVDPFGIHLPQTTILDDTPLPARGMAHKVRRMHCHSLATTSRSAPALGTVTPPAPRQALAVDTTRTGLAPCKPGVRVSG